MLRPINNGRWNVLGVEGSPQNEIAPHVEHISALNDRDYGEAIAIHEIAKSSVAASPCRRVTQRDPI